MLDKGNVKQTLLWFAMAEDVSSWLPLGGPQI
jgi:hypothetical protein